MPRYVYVSVGTVLNVSQYISIVHSGLLYLRVFIFAGFLQAARLISMQHRHSLSKY